ncbi:hypothetical protein KQY30_35540 [Streptomyces sp. GMY02]|uniref:hypothetical protein n=1 Tax=Streptomyces sp. GMY02 TaxID=1333528 RepID=UPI001C2C6A93|nr:hypothetical protein [Streptomyces sp. GMY02]QXE38737.1 hypothetical protein KQY30_35540 [Streptomyces sp. GMY02]
MVAGGGALVALVVAYREATRLYTERCSQAVEQLGSDTPDVRLGGVHALVGPADDSPATIPATRTDTIVYLVLRKVRHTMMRLVGDQEGALGHPGPFLEHAAPV